MPKEENTTPDSVDDIVAQEQEAVSADDFQDSDDKKMDFVGKVIDTLNNDPMDSTKDTDDDTEEDVEDDIEENVSDEDEDKDDAEDTSEQTNDATDDVEEEEIEIDARLVMAAKRRGWSDDKIVQIYQNDPTILEDIASLSEFQDSQDDEETEDEDEDISVDDSKKLQAIKFTDEQIAELRQEYGDVLVDTVILPMSKQNEQYAEVINKAQENEQKRSDNAKRKDELEFDKIFTQTLDDASKNYPQLGVWENVPCLPNGQVDLNCEMFQIRADLWDRAKFAKVVLGMSTKEAVEDALVYLKGNLREAEVEDKIVKKLNKQKKKMLNRPKRRNTQKTFKNKNEKIMHTMTEAFKEAGIE